MNTYHETLKRAAEHPRAQEAIASARAALTTLRFHEGLRKRWEHARAEAAIREASALAHLEGAPINVDDLRLASLNATTAENKPETKNPAALLATGIWQAQWNRANTMTPLNIKGARPTRQTTPIAGLISHIHRDICAPLVTAGHLNAQRVALPQNPQYMKGILHLLNSPAPALPLAADMWARLKTHEIFTPASGAVGATLARWILVENGIDPTAVAPISAWHVLNPAESTAGLHAWKNAQRPDLHTDEERVEYLSQWVATFAQGLTYGAQIGTDIALHIQAGKLA